MLGAGALTAGASHHETVITVRLLGEAAYVVAAPLEKFVERIHEEAMRLSVTCVVIDVRLLEFMSSACIRTLTAWIGKVARLPAELRYRFFLESRPSIHWQRRSLGALRNLAPELVEIG